MNNLSASLLDINLRKLFGSCSNNSAGRYLSYKDQISDIIKINIVTCEESERSSYKQSYMEHLVDIQTALKSLKKNILMVSVERSSSDIPEYTLLHI